MAQNLPRIIGTPLDTPLLFLRFRDEDQEPQEHYA